MLLPRFKLRTALIGLTAAAFVSLFLREGALGTEWAIGATIGLASLLLWLCMMALFFFVAILFRPSTIHSSERKQKGSFYASPSRGMVDPEPEEEKRHV